jgi:hypothetical protein
MRFGVGGGVHTEAQRAGRGRHMIFNRKWGQSPYFFEVFVTITI